MSAASAPIGDRDACVVGCARTPIGAFLGALSSLTAVELGAIAIKAAVSRSGVAPDQVEEVFFGNVLSAALGQAPARQAAIKAGLPASVPATTVNKVCASGMKATIFGIQNILLGHREVVVVGGMESMSNAPYYATKMRSGNKFGDVTLKDGMLQDGLWDSFSDQHMGNCGELCADKYSITRVQQDLYAAETLRRATAAAASGAFDAEIVPVTIAQKGGDIVVSQDETAVKNATSAGKADAKADDPASVPAPLAKLRPAFKKDGSITAGNASPLSDGAAALVIVSGAYAKRMGLTVQAVFRGYDDAAHAPEEFTTAPALAVPKALHRAGIEGKEVDLYELNEAFAVVALANARLLDLDVAKINVHGGAIALGHPLGCSGARILVTLIHALKRRGEHIGCAAVCNGGGGASAIVLQVL